MVYGMLELFRRRPRGDANEQQMAPAYLLIVVGERPPDLQAGVLIGVMYNNVIPVPCNVHCREEVRSMQQ